MAVIRTCVNVVLGSLQISVMSHSVPSFYLDEYSVQAQILV